MLLEGKKSKAGHTEEGKRDSFPLPTSPIPRDGTAWRQERLSLRVLSQRKGRAGDEGLAVLAVQGAAKKTYLFLNPSAILRGAT